MPLAEFKEQVEGFVKYLKETPPQEGFKEVLYPGEKEYYTTQQRLKEGIPIEDSTWKIITAWPSGSGRTPCCRASGDRRMSADASSRLREICLALPEAAERETWGHATFRVREKIFAMGGDDTGHWRDLVQGAAWDAGRARRGPPRPLLRASRTSGRKGGSASTSATAWTGTRWPT